MPASHISHSPLRDSTVCFKPKSQNDIHLTPSLAYPFLNVQKQHAKIVGWFAGIGAGIVAFFTLVRMVCVLRERIVRRRNLSYLVESKADNGESDRYDREEKKGGEAGVSSETYYETS